MDASLQGHAWFKDMHTGLGLGTEVPGTALGKGRSPHFPLLCRRTSPQGPNAPTPGVGWWRLVSSEALMSPSRPTDPSSGQMPFGPQFPLLQLEEPDSTWRALVRAQPCPAS